LKAVVERLRPLLRAFRDERGRELFDLPDAPRPGPETPAPPRFLPEYDNVLLSHDDRGRFVSGEARAAGSRVSGPIHGSVLHDGFLAGVWRLDRDRSTAAAMLVVSHTVPLTKRAIAALTAEGRRFLRFVAADSERHDVRFVPVT
jgi:hypothetical protein